MRKTLRNVQLKIGVFILLELAVLQLIRFAVESHAFDASDDIVKIS